MLDLNFYFNELKETKELPLVVVCGPTASGKTALSLKIAQEYNGEIISADSAQVYRGMDIGTAKVSPQEQKLVKHHLIDIRDPDQSFTMADFKREATWAIKDIHRRGRLPILCGGTGLYLSSVTEDYQLPKAPPNPTLRQEIQSELETKGKEHLHQKLASLDPESAAKIHPNNLRYVARALEIILQTHRPLSRSKAPSPYRVLKLAPHWDRDVLYDRINQRVEQQIEDGLLTEIKTLLERYPESLLAFSALGYKEFFPYLRGESPLELCKEQLKQNTRNFAKRQLTWFRKEEDILWLNPQTHAPQV